MSQPSTTKKILLGSCGLSILQMGRYRAVSKGKLAPVWSYEFKVINKLKTDCEDQGTFCNSEYVEDTQLLQQHISHSDNVFCLLQGIRFTLLAVSRDFI